MRDSKIWVEFAETSHFQRTIHHPFTWYLWYGVMNDLIVPVYIGTQRVAGHTSQFVDSVLKATARDNCLEEIHLNV